MLQDAGQQIDVWTRRKVFSMDSLCYFCVACQHFFVTTASDLLLSLLCVNQSRRWGFDYVWAFEFLGHLHITERKGKEKWKQILIAHVGWASSHIHICHTPSFNKHRSHSSYLAWFVLAGDIFFSLSAPQEPNALKARPRSRYHFHFSFGIRRTFLWCYTR